VILLALTMLAIGGADILGARDRKHPALACLVVTALTYAVAYGLGLSLLEATIVSGALFVTVGVWLGAARHRPGMQLSLLAAVLISAFAASGAIGAGRSTLANWYSNLHFGFVHTTSIDQFMLAVASAVFATASSNRIVKLILRAVGTQVQTGESRLKGGRILGPMERIFVGAMIVSGSLAGVGALIAAKGLLRLPEIRSGEDEQTGAGDDVTEYFLIGTFSSLLIAGTLGLLISASA
jgi:hypothetical protein